MSLKETNEEFHDLILRVATRTSQDFPSVSPWDLINPLWAAVDAVESSGVGPRDPGMKKYLQERSEAAAYAIRTQALQASAQYEYMVRDVSEIMETVFDREDWPAGYTPEDARVGERDGMASLEVRMDACYAFQKLPIQHREALISRYYDKVLPEVGTGAQKKLFDSLCRLTDLMNGE